MRNVPGSQGFFPHIEFWKHGIFAVIFAFFCGGALFPFKFYWGWPVSDRKTEQMESKTPVPPEHPKHASVLFC